MKQRIKGTLRDPEGNSLGTISLPAVAEHITFMKRQEMDAHVFRINSWLASYFKTVEAKEKKGKQVAVGKWKVKYLLMVRDLLCDYFELDPKDPKCWVNKLVKGNYQDHLSRYHKWNNEKPKLTLTMLGLYEYLFYVLFSYRPQVSYDEDMHFDVRGRRYTIKAFIRDEVVNKTINPKLTVMQNVEALSIEDYYNRHIKAKNNEDDYKQGDKTIKGYRLKAEYSFLKKLKIIAIFASYGGEKLPTEFDKFTKHIDEKIKELQHISMPDALNALFFLTPIKKI